MENKIIALKSRIVGSLSGFSSALSVLGSSWNVCHSACMTLLSFLAVFGIAVAGFPLFFLFEYNIQLWFLALALLAVSLFLFFRNKKCMPQKLLLFNSGVLIAGIPISLVNLQPFSWVVGGIIALFAITSFLFSKIKRRH